MATLRELLLSIKVAVDKKAVTETDQAFVHATTSAQGFENSLHRAVQGVKSIKREARLLADVWREAMAPARDPSKHAPTAPSARKVQADAEALGMPQARTGPRPPTKEANPFAAPDVSAFVQPSIVQRAGAAVQGMSARLKVARADFFAASGAGMGLGEALTSLNAGALILGSTLGMLSSRALAAIGDVIDMGSALNDASKRTRQSVETLQAWNKLAQLNGADSGAVESGFRKLARSANAAGRGSKMQAAAFKELGVSVKSANGQLKPTEELMIEVGAALNGLEDDTKATAIAAQILGPAGLSLIPIFEDGADAVRKQTAAFKENAAISKEEAAALDEIGDKLDLASGGWKALKTRLVIEVLPIVAKTVDWLLATVKWLREVSQTSKALSTSLMFLGGAGFMKLATLLGPWILRLTGAKNAMNLLGMGVRSATSALFKFLVPALIVEDFLVFLAGGKSVFGRVFEELLGSGGAVKAREEILAFFAKLQEAIIAIGPIVTQIGQLLGGVALDAATRAANAFLAVLNMIGAALTDDSKKAHELSVAMMGNFGKAFGIEGPKGDGAAVQQSELNKSGGPGAAKPEGWFDKALDLIPGFTASRKRNTEAIDAKARAAMGMSPVSPVPVAPTMPGSPAQGQTITIQDQRKLSVEVRGTDSPGAVGAATANAVGGQLDRDRRQVLQAVSG